MENGTGAQPFTMSVRLDITRQLRICCAVWWWKVGEGVSFMSFATRAFPRSRGIFVVLLLLTSLPLVPIHAAPPGSALLDPYPGRDGFFGMVGRDPWYEINSDPKRFPNEVNKG